VGPAILGAQGNIGIAFVIPADLALAVAERFQANKGVVWHGFLGLQVDDEAEGVRVVSVAKREGGQPFAAGDLLLAIDGNRVLSARQVRRVVDGTKPGSPLTVRAQRSGKTLELRAVVDDLGKFFSRR
jgi:S1-C subfamily serine protease